MNCISIREKEQVYSMYPTPNVLPYLPGGGGGDLAPSLPVCVVTKWRDMGNQHPV